MVEKEEIRRVVEELIEGQDIFLVEVELNNTKDLEVILDSDTTVSIDSCVAISRHLADHFGEQLDEFSLMVSSAGIGQPLKLLRQYQKLVGKSVEIVLKTGAKIVALLLKVDSQAMEVSYMQSQQVEGKKRKQMVEVTEKIDFDKIKSTVEHLDFS